MKFLILWSLILLSLPSWGIKIEFIGPCDEKPFFARDLQAPKTLTVGDLTIDVLENAKIPYQGNAQGLNQILNSPLGMSAYEIVSDHEMMAYGWCYEVDGIIPESYPDKVSIDGIKKIRWFYAYAHFLNGNWISQCSASYLRKSPFICR